MADADPCWSGFEQRGTKEKDGKTVPNCVKADDVERAIANAAWRVDCLSQRMDACENKRSDATAGEYRKLVNAVDYAISTLQSARNSEVQKASRELQQATARLQQADPPRGKPEDVEYLLRAASRAIDARKGDIGKKD